MDSALTAAFLVLGVASGLHCAGMCGGIVAAFSARRLIPIVPAGRAAPERRHRACAPGRGVRACVLCLT